MADKIKFKKPVDFNGQTIENLNIPDEALAGKQDKLVAGDNITIEDNVISATTDSDICVKKTGDTMTGDLTINGNISLGTNKNINLANGDKIIYGGIESSGSTFEIKAVHQPTGSEHIISLDKVGITSGIKFIQKANMDNYAVGYHQLPINDGSSASDYYTLATREWVEEKLSHLVITGQNPYNDIY